LATARGACSACIEYLKLLVDGNKPLMSIAQTIYLYKVGELQDFVTSVSVSGAGAFEEHLGGKNTSTSYSPPTTTSGMIIEPASGSVTSLVQIAAATSGIRAVGRPSARPCAPAK
jgi:hypothetical protein